MISKQKILSSSVQCGRSWGTYGKGHLYALTLGCGHTEYQPYSRGIPKSGLIHCTTCAYKALRAKVEAKQRKEQTA